MLGRRIELAFREKLTRTVLDIQTLAEAAVPQCFPPEIPLLPGGPRAGVELHLVIVVPVRVQTFP